MSFPTGITNINNLAPELPVQAAEDLLSTPQFNLIHSFGADLHHAETYIGKTTRMSRFERLSTDGGQLDGSGIDPASEVPVRSDIDATMEIYAKSIVTNEQVVLYENSKTLTKFTALLGQWLREKEDLLMRDLFASSVSYINATGGTFTATTTLLSGDNGISGNVTRTNFSLPDTRTRTLRGAGTGYALGATGGADTKSLVIGNIPNHSHLQYSAGSTGVASGLATAGGTVYNINTIAVGGVVNTDGSGVSGGLGQAFSIVNPYIVINYIIKYA
jgi:microcystin-dependent protein